jgi:hypothetical protein
MNRREEGTAVYPFFWLAIAEAKLACDHRENVHGHRSLTYGARDVPRFPIRHLVDCGVSVVLRIAVEPKVNFILDRSSRLG